MGQKVSLDKKHLFWQSLGAILYVTLVLVCLDVISVNQVLWAVGSTSLASSAYLVFSQPTRPAASSFKLLGGYFIAIFCGLLVRHFSEYLLDLVGHLPDWLVIAHDPHMFWLLGSIAVGFAMVLMLLFQFEHPPAAGMALVLVLEERSFPVILLTYLLVVLLALIQVIFRPCLRDL